MAMAPPIELTEEGLVRRAQAGDRAAFQDLYGRYLAKVYDFTLGMLRNRADAEDATSETFLRAVERLSELRDPAAFKSWLYAIARNAALRIIEGRKRYTPVANHLEEAPTVATAALASPDERAEDVELRELFEMAVSTLSERDRTVFELSVRHGLSSAEVASVLQVRTSYAYILVNRLKGSMNEALEALLLSHSNGHCQELAKVLEGFSDGELSPRMRKAVSRHARDCEVCSETRRRRGAVPALLQGVAFAEPSGTFAEELTAQIDARWGLRSEGSSTSTSGRTLAQGAGVTTAVLIFAGVLCGASAQRTITPIEEASISRAAARTEALETQSDEQLPRLNESSVSSGRIMPQHAKQGETLEETTPEVGNTYARQELHGEDGLDGESTEEEEDAESPSSSAENPTSHTNYSQDPTTDAPEQDSQTEQSESPDEQSAATKEQSNQSPENETSVAYAEQQPPE